MDSPAIEVMWEGEGVEIMYSQYQINQMDLFYFSDMSE